MKLNKKGPSYGGFLKLAEKVRDFSVGIGVVLTGVGFIVPNALDGGYPEGIGIRSLIVGGLMHLVVSEKARDRVASVLKKGAKKINNFGNQ